MPIIPKLPPKKDKKIPKITKDLLEKKKAEKPKVIELKEDTRPVEVVELKEDKRDVIIVDTKGKETKKSVEMRVSRNMEESQKKMKEESDLKKASSWMSKNKKVIGMFPPGTITPSKVVESGNRAQEGGALYALGTLMLDALPAKGVSGLITPKVTSGVIRGTIKKLIDATDPEEVSKILKADGAKPSFIKKAATEISKANDIDSVMNALVKAGEPSNASLIKKAEAISAKTKIRPSQIQKTSADILKANKPLVPKITKNTYQLLKERLRTAQKASSMGARSARKTIKETQNILVSKIKEELPIRDRGGFLTLVKNTTSPDKLIDAAERIEKKVIKNEQARVLLAGIKKAQNKIARIKKIAEIDQIAVTKTKQRLGIEKPISRMNESELNQVADELNKIFEYKKSKGFKPQNKALLDDPDMPDINKPVYDDDFYKGVQEFEKDRKSITKEFMKASAQKADKYGGLMSTRLENIHPVLKYKMRSLEALTMMHKHDSVQMVIPAIRKIKKLVSKADFKDLDIAMKNGDDVKLDALIKKYGMKEEFEAIREVLDDIYVRASDVGLDIGYREDFFPRVIKDADGLIEYLKTTEKWSAINKAIEDRIMKVGPDNVSHEDMALIADNLLRGFRPEGVSLSTPGALKARNIEKITPELNQFYGDSISSLMNYIDRVNEAIEARKFFGKGLKTEVGGVPVDQSIGAYTLKLLQDGVITYKEEKILTDILRARFNEKGPGKFWSAVKNLTYIDIMASPVNTVTQIGDLGYSLYKNGAYRTIKALAKDVVGANNFTKEDLGITAAVQEFSEGGSLAKLTKFFFDAVGFSRIDSLGKNTFINASMETLQKQIKNKDRRLGQELIYMFGDEAPQVVSDIKAGKHTENVKVVLFNKLADVQPIAMSELPEAYAVAKNARVLYMLKSFTLKAIDVYRRDVFREIASGDLERMKYGMGNLVRLTGYLALMGATAQEIKNLMLNRESEGDISDKLANSALGVVGLNKYLTEEIKREGLGTALKEQAIVLPTILDSAVTDIANEKSIDEGKSIKSLPLVGKLYYYWFGNGAQINEPIKKKKVKKKKVKKRS